MDRIKDLLSTFKEFLNFKIYDSEQIHITVGTFLAIIISLIAVRFILLLVRKLATAKLPEEDKNKFESIFDFLKYLFYVLAVVIVLSSSGIDLTLILTASAALFVGLGFALQHLFQDIISGILIILDQSLHVGDIINVNGKIGRVFEIRLRTTRALTRDDKVIIIPNHKFLSEVIYNYTQNYKNTREQVNVGVAYGSDVEKVTEILLACVEKQERVLKHPKPFVLFDDFADSALLFSVHFYINDSYNAPFMKSDIRYNIDAAFRSNGITIPFPQRDVHLFQNATIPTKNDDQLKKGDAS